MLRRAFTITTSLGVATVATYSFWPKENKNDSPHSVIFADEPKSVFGHLFKGWKNPSVHFESSSHSVGPSPSLPPLPIRVPTREEQLTLLQSTQEFDLLVVGGGATGSGIALDAASRGLNVALVERDDFASGTSSRSTKLVHGGVRYLEKAFRNLDYEQYKLVREALHERTVFLQIAPHLSSQLPIMLPIYSWWQVPYYWVGAKVYDFLAGDESLESSYFLSRSKALEKFPMLKKEHLCGAVVYYDGQHNDARMNVTLAMTAAAYGATVANHCEVMELLHRPLNASEETLQSIPMHSKTGLIRFDQTESTAKESSLSPTTDATMNQRTVVCGAKIKDHLTGQTFLVRAKGVINATGPFSDDLRAMDHHGRHGNGITATTNHSTAGNPIEPIVCPSSGVHIVLPNYYAPRDMGLIDPSTSDGRVIFFLPWQNHTIAGTTDSPTEITALPRPKDEEIHFILDEVSRYLDKEIEVRRGDVSSAWSGIRPLVRSPNRSSHTHHSGTQGLVRNHMVLVSDQRLMTVAGGKWTTYRQMAEDAVDVAMAIYQLKAVKSFKSRTRDLKLLGAHHFHPLMFIQLIQMYGLEREVAEHLVFSYGDRAFLVADYCRASGQRWPVLGRKLHPQFPYLEEEVLYCVDHESARTLVDVLARRTRLAFLNVEAAEQTLPRLVELMGQRLGWDRARKRRELAAAEVFLGTMGLEPGGSQRLFNANEIIRYRKAFTQMDKNVDGSVSMEDLKEYLTSLSLSEREIAKYAVKFDKNKNGMLEFTEFLELMSELRRTGKCLPVEDMMGRRKISIERSGGGV